MNKNSSEVEILVNGKPVREYEHQGNTYIEARDGTEYTVKIKNNSGSRKMAIITIDGVNCITGNPQGTEIQNGYIVNGYDAIEIRGFRKDISSVGAFKFCRKSKSYCNEKGLKGNNGVIGVRIYEEKTNPVLWRYIKDELSKKEWPPYKITPLWNENVYYDDHYTTCCDSNIVQCSNVNYKSAPDFDLGTTWGKKIDDAVTYVNFEANESSCTEFVIYYNTRDNLKSIGIYFHKEKQVSLPRPFGPFCSPPKGWRG